MKKANRILPLLCSLLFFGHTSFAQFNGVERNLKSVGSADQGKIAVTLLISFVIGNVIAWSMGAYPKDFDTKPYSEDESEMIRDLTIEIRENPEEADIRTELGTLYFQHNDLDKAEALLEEAVELDSSDAEALAVYSANEAKQSGAMWDFTWGIWKLKRMGDAVDGLNRAVELDPDNFTVRLYRMSTLVGLENRKGSFDRIFEDEQWFKQKTADDPEFLPAGVRLVFYDVLAEAYAEKERLSGDNSKGSHNLKKADEYKRLSTRIHNNDQ